MIRRFILSDNIKFEKKAGISALCEYSLLSDNAYPTYAVTKKEIKDSGIKTTRQVGIEEKTVVLFWNLAILLISMGKVHRIH